MSHDVSCDLTSCSYENSSEVWNTRPGGVLVCAPPCGPWIFLSSSVTGRSWTNPNGDPTSRCVLLANIFVRRMMYVQLSSLVCSCMFACLRNKNGTC